MGGVSVVKEAALLKGINLGLFSDYSISGIFNRLTLAFGWGLGYFGQPHILSKFMGINKTSEMHKSKYIGIAWQVLSLGAATFVGLVGIAYFKAGLANPEMIYVETVKSLFSPFWGGFILCAIFAAIISTIDSQVLVLASTITEDFYRESFRKNASEKELSWVFRVAIGIVCVFSAILALNRLYTVEDFVWIGWTGIGSAFAPLVILSLYSKDINRKGALAGMICGPLVAMLWRYYASASIHAMVPAFIMGLVVIKLVSKLTSKD